MSKMMVILMVVVLAVIGGTVAYFSFSHSIDPKTYVVKRGTIRRSANGVGKVETMRPPMDLSFTLPGRVKMMTDKQEGDLVTPDLRLAELEPDAQVAKQKQCEAALKEAEAKLKQFDESAKPENIAEAEARLERAQAEVAASQARLNNLVKPVAPPAASQYQVEEARLQVERLRYDQNAATFEQDRLFALPNPFDKAVAEQQISLAKVDIDEAKEKVETLKSEGYWDRMHKHEQNALLHNIDRMDAKYKLTQAEFDRIKQGATEQEKKVAIAKVKAATTVYDLAVLNAKRLENPLPPPPASLGDQEVARQELAQAKAREKEAGAALAGIRAKKSNAERDMLQAAVDNASESLNLAAYELKQTKLNAPYAATIISRHVEPGSAVHAGQAVFTMLDLSLDHLYIRIELDSSWASDLKVTESMDPSKELKAYFSAPFLKDGELVGVIKRVMGTASQKTLFTKDPTETKGGEVIVAVAILKPPSPNNKQFYDALKPGLRVNCRVDFDSHENVLVVPKSFLRVEDGEPVVYKAESRNGSKAGGRTRVPVQVGFSDGLNVEILAGLQEGDVLVKPADSPDKPAAAAPAPAPSGN